MCTSQYNRCSMRDCTEAQALSFNNLWEIIRAVVCEEFWKMFLSSQSKVASNANIICKEIQQSLGAPELPQPEAHLCAPYRQQLVGLFMKVTKNMEIWYASTTACFAITEARCETRLVGNP